MARRSVALEGLDAALVAAFVQLDQAERARFTAHQRCGELVRALIRVRHPEVPVGVVCELFPRPDGGLDLAWREEPTPIDEPAPTAPRVLPADNAPPAAAPAAPSRRERRRGA